jgi:hypothetical protein
MTKAGKTVLQILTWGPLIWTLLILFEAKHFNFAIDSFKRNLPKDLFFWTAAFYILYGGFFIWLALTALFALGKKISKKQCIVHVSIIAIGILSAYLSFHFDIFCVSGCYID